MTDHFHIGNLLDGQVVRNGKCQAGGSLVGTAISGGCWDSDVETGSERCALAPSMIYIEIVYQGEKHASHALGQQSRDQAARRSR